MSRIMARPRIILFGDSLTQYGFGTLPSEIANNSNYTDDETYSVGWASLLATWYQRKADIVDRGYAGYNSRHALELFPRRILPLLGDTTNNTVLFTTLWFGANDAAVAGSIQHVPLEQYEDNIRQLVDRITATSSSTNPRLLLLLTPPPVDAAKWDRCKPYSKSPDRSNAVAREYGNVVKKVAEGTQEKNVAVVDVWQLLEGNDESKCTSYLSDGLHLNAKGNIRVFEGIRKVICEKYPHLDPTNDEKGPGLEELPWKELPLPAKSK